MKVKNKPAFEDYTPNLIPEAIEITMEELDMTREEAVKFMKKTSYERRYGKQKKGRTRINGIERVSRK